MSELTQTHITIIGGGRIGRTFAAAAPNHTLIKRGDSLSNVPSGPIVICTRNDDLGPIVDALSPQRHSDLIFVQNGMIENFLASKNISHTTQVLLYIAVSTVGAKAVDGEKTVATGRSTKTQRLSPNLLIKICSTPKFVASGSGRPSSISEPDKPRKS